ncbi:hypothetical protein DL768_006723 [Monosporascus sp. mg162]|nr:hypothetical protein DL768_006723 [Monosporascus sp. mg162]
MQSITIFISLLVLFQPLALGFIQSETLKERIPVLRALGDLIDGLVNGLIPGLIDLANQEDKECRFVGEVNATVLLAYEDMNVVVFHDELSSIGGLRNRVCYEKGTPRLFNDKIYTICVFEEGQFIRSGDGGCRNWGFGGCTAQTSDKTVNFCRRTTEPTTPAITTTAMTATSGPAHWEPPEVPTVTTASEPANSEPPSVTMDPTLGPVSPTTQVVTSAIVTQGPDLLPTTQVVPTIITTQGPDHLPTTQVVTSVIVTQVPDLLPTTQVAPTIIITQGPASNPPVQNIPEVQGGGGASLPAGTTTRTIGVGAPKATQPVVAAAAAGIAAIYFAVA